MHTYECIHIETKHSHIYIMCIEILLYAKDELNHSKYYLLYLANKYEDDNIIFTFLITALYSKIPMDI